MIVGQMNKEIWVTAIYGEGKYEVSNLGGIRRVLKNSKKTLSPYISSSGYKTACLSFNKKRKSILLHRMIWESFNHETSMFIDHADGDTLNNCLSNLRKADFTESSRNRGSRTGRSRFKGVYWRERSQKWEVYIKLENSRPYLGSFDCEIEAGKAYNKRCKQEFGKFARLNKIGETNENN